MDFNECEYWKDGDKERAFNLTIISIFPPCFCILCIVFVLTISIDSGTYGWLLMGTQIKNINTCVIQMRRESTWKTSKNLDMC